MQYAEVEGIGKPVSRLVQGTVMVNSEDVERSLALLDGVYSLGCNTFDTGHIYESGDSERILGRWMAERGIREKVVISDKGAHPSEDRNRVTPFDIAADLHDSLARLKTDYIDLYMLHRDDLSVPVGQIVEAMNEHVEAGRIKTFGASNWTVERIEAANGYARAHNLAQFAASSPQFSLAEQMEVPWPGTLSITGPKGEAAREWYAQTQMPVFAWSSLAGGFFSERFTRDNLDSFEDYFDKLCVQCYCCEENFARLDRVRTLAEEKGLTVAQVALSYVLSQPMNVFAVMGCRTPGEFESNLKALEVKLTPEEITWLNLKTDSR